MHPRASTRELLGTVSANRELRRVGLAFAGFNAHEWAVWVALLVYAYERGGAAMASLAAVAQLVPAGLFAPFAARFADRGAPARVLFAGYLAQAATLAVTAVALFAGVAPIAVFALAGLAASATTITRPAQAALVPALVRVPEELTAANVVLGWIESVSVFVAPAVAGALLAVSVPATVFAAMGALALVSAALVARVHGPVAAASGAQEHAFAELNAGMRVVAGDPQARLLVGALSMQFVLIGALDVLFVVLAIDVLGLGGSGAGYLNAAFGAGGVLGIALTVRLIGRARLMPALVAASLAWSGALLALGLWQAAGAAFVLLAAAGAARHVLDVAARTLLQRSAPPGVLARVFGVLEMLDAVGLAIGALLVPALVATLGPAAAVAGLAVLPPLLLALAGRRLRDVDRHADVPVVEIALLRSIDIFAPLGAEQVEALARGLTPVTVQDGECVLREGQPGERYYVIASGELEISRAGRAIARRGRGSGVGEISLLARVPCVATVTAVGRARLYAIEPDAFLAAVSGHAGSAAVARRLVRERLQPSAST